MVTGQRASSQVRPDGVHLPYDAIVGFSAYSGNPEALKVAQDVASKMEALLIAAAKS